MKRSLLILLFATVTASADVWSGKDDWTADTTPGFVRVPRVNHGDGKKTVTFVNVDQIVRLSITAEGEGSRATLEIVTTEPRPVADRVGDDANINVTYKIRFDSLRADEEVVRGIMKKKADQAATPIRPEAPAPKPIAPVPSPQN